MNFSEGVVLFVLGAVGALILALIGVVWALLQWQIRTTRQDVDSICERTDRLEDHFNDRLRSVYHEIREMKGNITNIALNRLKK